MNLSEDSRASTLALLVPREGDSSVAGWKGYVVKAAIFGVTFGTYVLFFRRKSFLFPGILWNSRKHDGSRNGKEERSNENGGDSDSSEFMYDCYNREICPICLCLPKIGLRASCGHLLCAHCLASYCEVVRVASAAPPCPLCRVPLNSVTLADDSVSISGFADPSFYFFAIKPHSREKFSTSNDNATLNLLETAGDSERSSSEVEPNIRAWIREYNLRGFPTTGGRLRALRMSSRKLIVIDCITLLFIIALIAVKLQVFPWRNRPFAPVIDVILNILLIGCLWFKTREPIANELPSL